MAIIPRMSCNCRQQRFSLDADEMELLIDLTVGKVDAIPEIYGLTRTIRDHFSHEERIAMLQTLREVAKPTANCTIMKQASCVRLPDFCMSQARKAGLRGNAPANAWKVRIHILSSAGRQLRIASDRGRVRHDLHRQRELY